VAPSLGGKAVLLPQPPFGVERKARRRAVRRLRRSGHFLVNSLRRALTPDLRRDLGLSIAKEKPYRWSFAVLVVGIAAVPLLFAGYVKTTLALALVAFVILPAFRFWEHREARLRVRVYEEGEEAIGTVLAVEPPGADNEDRPIVVEFDARGARIEARVSGCRLARRGLGPGETVRVVFDPQDPSRCLVTERVTREIVDCI
jgi:hypothetical protein